MCKRYVMNSHHQQGPQHSSLAGPRAKGAARLRQGVIEIKNQKILQGAWLAGRWQKKKKTKNEKKKPTPLSQAWDDWGKLSWEKNYLRMTWNSYCVAVVPWCVSLFWLLASPKERIRCSPWVRDGEIQSWGKLAYFPPRPCGRRLMGSRGPKGLIILCILVYLDCLLLSLSRWRLRDA